MFSLCSNKTRVLWDKSVQELTDAADERGRGWADPWVHGSPFLFPWCSQKNRYKFKWPRGQTNKYLFKWLRVTPGLGSHIDFIHHPIPTRFQNMRTHGNDRYMSRIQCSSMSLPITSCSGPRTRNAMRFLVGGMQSTIVLCQFGRCSEMEPKVAGGLALQEVKANFWRGKPKLKIISNFERPTFLDIHNFPEHLWELDVQKTWTLDVQNFLSEQKYVSWKITFFRKRFDTFYVKEIPVT